MDAPKAKRDKEKRKRGLSRHLPAEFLAEYPMEECINRLLRCGVYEQETLKDGGYRFWVDGGLHELQVKVISWDERASRIILERAWNQSPVRDDLKAVTRMFVFFLLLGGLGILLNDVSRLLLMIGLLGAFVGLIVVLFLGAISLLLKEDPVLSLQALLGSMEASAFARQKSKTKEGDSHAHA